MWAVGRSPYGWVNSDLEPWPGVDVVADGLPLGDDTFDYIVSIHTLPELPYPDLDRAIQELHRVLRQGGVLRLSLPDLDKAIQAYLHKDVDYFLIPDEVTTTMAGELMVQLTWYGRSIRMSPSSWRPSSSREMAFRNLEPAHFARRAAAFRHRRSPASFSRGRSGANSGQPKPGIAA